MDETKIENEWEKSVNDGKNSVEWAEYKESQKIKEDTVKKWENKKARKSLIEIPNTIENNKKSREFMNAEDTEELRAQDIRIVRELLEKKKKEKEQKMTFSGILEEMDKLHTKKNTDYGNAWHEEMQEFGPICGVLRLYEKTKRLVSLYKNGKAEVNDESFEDTLLDIANYAVMTLEEMRNMKKE